MSVHHPHLQALQAPSSDSEAAAWFVPEPKPTSSGRLWDEADTREYFAHRMGRKPPRHQSVKKRLEVYQEGGRANGHLGLHSKGSEVLRRVWQSARENATPFTPRGELL
jgi:hypothetical protein